MKLYDVLHAMRFNYGVLTNVNRRPVSMKEAQKLVRKAVKRDVTSVIVRHS